MIYLNIRISGLTIKFDILIRFLNFSYTCLVINFESFVEEVKFTFFFIVTNNITNLYMTYFNKLFSKFNTCLVLFLLNKALKFSFVNVKKRG